MRLLTRKTLLILSILCLVLFAACLDDDDSDTPQPLMVLSLYTGIPGVASIGESRDDVLRATQLPHETQSVDDALTKLNFSDALFFSTIGTTVYFRRDGVAMITAQEPFKGVIKDKTIHLFAFAVPAVSDWEALLLKELGSPQARASGGRLNSEALFYSWGDISYNHMGPNQIALYRDPRISDWRLHHFGRQLILFKNN